MPQNDINLNPRQREFARAMVKERLPANRAYAKAYGVDPNSDATYSNASRLIRKDKVKASMAEYEKEFDQIAAKALERQIDLSQSNQTGANVKNDINKWLIGLAGYSPVQRTENKTETTYKGLNDDKAYNELVEQAYKAIDGKG